MNGAGNALGVRRGVDGVSLEYSLANVFTITICDTKNIRD